MRHRAIAAFLATVLLVWPLAVAGQPTVHHVGPSYLYPDPVKTPGAVNPDITQANDGLRSELVHEVNPAAGGVHERAQGAAARRLQVQGQEPVPLLGRPLHLA